MYKYFKNKNKTAIWHLPKLFKDNVNFSETIKTSPVALILSPHVKHPKTRP
jgi:hypothetical protein